jgi:hypothetical protein
LGAAALVAVGAAGPSVAGPQHIQTIHEQCGIQLNGTAAFCTCLSNTAGQTLNENQQAFTAAQVTQNAAEIARVQPLLSADDAMGVMDFMTTFGGCQP